MVVGQLQTCQISSSEVKNVEINFAQNLKQFYLGNKLDGL